MKRYFFKFILVLFSFIFLSGFLYAKKIELTIDEQNYIDLQTIKVAMTPNIFPFEMYNNKKLNAFSYDVLKLISKKTGLNFSLDINVWDKELNQKEKLIPLVYYSKSNINKFNNSIILNNQNIFDKSKLNEMDLLETVEYYGLHKRSNKVSFIDVDLVLSPLLSIQVNLLASNNIKNDALSFLKIEYINKEDFKLGISGTDTLLNSIIKKAFDDISLEKWQELNDKWKYNKSNINRDLTLTNSEKVFIKTRRKINICVNPNLAPFEFLDEKEKLTGLSLDILNLLEKQMNIEFVFVKSNSQEESLSFLYNQKCDVISSIENKIDSNIGVLQTNSYLSYNVAIISQKGESNIHNLDLLMNKKIALSQDTNFLRDLQLSYKNMDLLKTKNNKEALEVVDNEEAFYTLSPLPIASFYMTKHAMTNLYISSYTNIPYKINMATRSSDVILFNILNKYLNTISAEQKKQIKDKWKNLPIKKVFDYSILWKTFIFLILITLFFLYRQKVLNRHNKELSELSKVLEVRVKEEIKENEIKTKQLIQQSRLAQMGELINMIAHQWRQPLTSISATTNNILLKSKLDKKIEKEVLEDELHLIVDYSKELSSTIDDFRNLYKADKIKEDVLLEDIVEKSLNIIGASLSHNNISIHKKFKSYKRINTFSREVNQVILNILKNAEDALLEKNIKKPQIIISTFTNEKKVYLEISDNAGGIKDEYIPLLFDPYFSTKKAKNGSGLGLYMSKIIIENNCSGNLDLDTSSSGTKFIITLDL